MPRFATKVHKVGRRTYHLERTTPCCPCHAYRTETCSVAHRSGCRRRAVREVDKVGFRVARFATKVYKVGGRIIRTHRDKLPARETDHEKYRGVCPTRNLSLEPTTAFAARETYQWAVPRQDTRARNLINLSSLQAPTYPTL